MKYSISPIVAPHHGFIKNPRCGASNRKVAFGDRVTFVLANVPKCVARRAFHNHSRWLLYTYAIYISGDNRLGPDYSSQKS